MIQHISSHDQIIYKDAVGFALTNSNIYLTHADVKTKKSTEQSGTTFNQLTQLTTGSIYECAFSHQNFQHTANGTRLQYSCLENPMDGGAWQAAVHGVAKSRARLSDFTFPFHCHALEKEMATHSSVRAWRIPGTGEPGGLLSMGSHRVRHNLAAAAAKGLNM